MKRTVKVHIIFNSGHVHDYTMDISAAEDVSDDELEESLLTLSKAMSGHAERGNLDAMWAMIHNKPLSVFSINTAQVAFVSLTLCD